MVRGLKEKEKEKEELLWSDHPPLPIDSERLLTNSNIGIY